jgi:hypothetical protein
MYSILWTEQYHAPVYIVHRIANCAERRTPLGFTSKKFDTNCQMQKKTFFDCHLSFFSLVKAAMNALRLFKN